MANAGNRAGAARPDDGGLRTVQREVAEARDAQLLQIVAIVDAMQDRGAADGLIAPLRDRLARMRPRRTMSLRRLLFMPLDPLIVPAASWRRESLGIPRTALQVLATSAIEAMGADADACAAALAQVSPARDSAGQEADYLAIGERLWPLAGAALQAGPMPADWVEATGLQPADHTTIARTVGALLREGALLQRMATAIGREPEPQETEQLLCVAAATGGDALAKMTALLLCTLRRPDAMVQAADDIAAKLSDPAARAGVDRALEFVLEQASQVRLPVACLPEAAGEVRQYACVISDLATRAAQRPARQKRLEDMRRALDGQCRSHFASEIDEQLLAPAAAGLADASDTTVAALEATARDLRRFEAVARQIGSADEYDRQLRRAAAAFGPQPEDSMTTRMDRARLMEILRGAEAAQACFPELAGPAA